MTVETKADLKEISQRLHEAAVLIDAEDTGRGGIANNNRACNRLHYAGTLVHKVLHDLADAIDEIDKSNTEVILKTHNLPNRIEEIKRTQAKVNEEIGDRLRKIESRLLIDDGRLKAADSISRTHRDDLDRLEKRIFNLEYKKAVSDSVVADDEPEAGA